MYHQSLARTLPNTSPLYCYRFIAASSRPPSTLPSRYQSRLQSQLKRCQDQSLVYRRFIVNASRHRSLSVIHSISVHCQATVTVSSPRYLFSSQCPQHAISSLRSVTSPSPIPRQGVSPTHSPCVLQHHKSASSLRQYVTNSSSKCPLVPGILSKTLPKHCQSTFRESCLIKSFSTRRQIISDELPVLSLSRPRSSTSSRS